MRFTAILFFLVGFFTGIGDCAAQMKKFRSQSSSLARVVDGTWEPLIPKIQDWAKDETLISFHWNNYQEFQNSDFTRIQRIIIHLAYKDFVLDIIAIQDKSPDTNVTSFQMNSIDDSGKRWMIKLFQLNDTRELGSIMIWDGIDGYVWLMRPQ